MSKISSLRLSGVFLIVLTVFLLFAGCVLAEEAYITGAAFLDSDFSGELDGAEQLLSGVPLALQIKTEKGWERRADTVSDEEGCYSFAIQEEGCYRVISAMRDDHYCISSMGEDAGWSAGIFHSAEMTIALGEFVEGPMIGVSPAVPFSVSAFEDKNGNGTQNDKGKPLSGMTVRLMTGEIVDFEAVSDRDGIAYLSAPEGNYTLYVLLPGGYGLTSLDGDTSFAGDLGSAAMEIRLSADMQPIVCTATSVTGISGQVFEDVNSDGIMNEGDLPVGGVIVHAVHNKTNQEFTGVSDESGSYMVTLPITGKYTITADIPEGMLYARYTKNGGDLRSIFSRTTVTREFSVKSTPLTNKNIGIVQQGSIFGYAFLDINYNGLWDEGEPPYEGVTVEIIKVSNEESYGKMKTDKNGYYCIENLRGGDYRVRAVLPDDGSIFSLTGEGEPDEVNCFVQKGDRRETSVEPIEITSGAQAEVIVGVARGSVIKGRVFHDKDYSGIENGKEKGIAGIRVRAVAEDGTVAGEGNTGKNGDFVLKGILPGNYRVEFQRKAGYGFTRNRAVQKGGSHVVTIEEDWGICEYITIGMDETVKDINAGMLPAATVKGSLIHDSNDNGMADKGEVGLPGASVRLWSEDAEMDFTVTPDEAGQFRFDGVMPGSYSLEYLLPEHCAMTCEEQYTDNILKVISGESYDLPKACAVILGTYEGTVAWQGQGVEGAVIALHGQHGHEGETVSNETGAFSISDLRPDEYKLSVQLPSGYIFAEAEDTEGLLWPCDTQAEMPIDWGLLSVHNQKQLQILKPAVLSGQIWMDENQNGIHDPDEWIMPGIKMILTDENANTVAETTTDENGYRFDKVRPGSYSLNFVLPEQSSPVGEKDTLFGRQGSELSTEKMNVSEGEERIGLDVGLVSTTSLGGSVLLNEAGYLSPVNGVRVMLLKDGTVLADTISDGNGAYRFDGLWPNNYQIRVALPVGCIFIREGDTNYPNDFTIVHAEKGNMADSRLITLEMAQHQLDLNVVCIKSGMVGDLAWLDENENGLLDGNEKRLAGVKVHLLQNGEIKYEEVTDAFGYYLFDDVYPGNYVLEASAYAELKPTKQVPALRIISTCLISGDGINARSEEFSVQSGQKNMDFDLGYVLLPDCTLPQEAIQEQPTKDWSLVNTAPRTEI